MKSLITSTVIVIILICMVGQITAQENEEPKVILIVPVRMNNLHPDFTGFEISATLYADGVGVSGGPEYRTHILEGEDVDELVNFNQNLRIEIPASAIGPHLNIEEIDGYRCTLMLRNAQGGYNNAGSIQEDDIALAHKPGTEFVYQIEGTIP